jgi:hypothetical protein
MDLKVKISLVSMCEIKRLLKRSYLKSFFHIINISLCLLLTW